MQDDPCKKYLDEWYKAREEGQLYKKRASLPTAHQEIPTDKDIAIYVESSEAKKARRENEEKASKAKLREEEALKKYKECRNKHGLD